MLKGENLKNAENFTVLELWKERKFPYIHFLLEFAGVNIASSYEARYNKRPEKVEVYEEEPGRTFIVNQYPGTFRKEANKTLNRLQAKYKKNLPRTEPRKKRARVKRQKINQPVKC